MSRKRNVTRVVVLLGSPRRKGNSATLAARVAAGARAEGAAVETFFLQGMDIAPCTACEGCHRPGRTGCVIDDDMQGVYSALEAADAIVFASPVYFFSMSAQMKAALDRCYALQRGATHAFAGKRVALAFSYADPDPLTSGVVNAIGAFKDACEFCGCHLAGTVHGSAAGAGEIASNRPLLKQARALGRKLVAG